MEMQRMKSDILRIANEKYDEDAQRGFSYRETGPKVSKA